MDNEKNLAYYKNSLELFSNDLMKLVSGLTQEEYLDVNADNYLTPCQIWKIIKYFLVGESYDFSSIESEFKFKEDLRFNLNDGILNGLGDELESLIDSNYIKNCKLKEQLRRAFKLFNCLTDAIKQLNCNDKCEFLVGILFCLLVQIILLVIAIIAKIIILLIFCDDCSTICNKKDVASSFCNCLIWDLEKELNTIEELINKLIELAIAFIECSSKECSSKKCKCNGHEFCDSCYEKPFYVNKYNNDKYECSNKCEHCNGCKRDDYINKYHTNYEDSHYYKKDKEYFK